MEKYTTGELGIKLDEIKESISELKKDNIEAHAKMDVKQDKTNGRVKNLELWKMFLMGAWAVLSMATPIAWYFILGALDNFSKSMDARIETIVSRAIDEYDDKIFIKK